MKRRSTVGDNTIAYMKQEGCFVVAWGDGCLVEIAFNSGITVSHPLNKMDKAVQALARDKRFECRLMRGHDSRGRQRLVRSFRLREEYRA
jgi:hypothetical protein